MTEEQEKAVRGYESALTEVRKQIVGKKGAANENLFGEAYRKMVAVGVAPQLKSRYRIGVQHAV